MDIIAQVLTVIRRHQAIHGYPPSLREIAQAASCGVSTVHRALEALEERGEISRTPGVARSITITAESARRWVRRRRLLELAADFELAAAHEAEFVVDGEGDHACEGETDDEPGCPACGRASRACSCLDQEDVTLATVGHAIRCALFRGYALGIRRAIRDSV